MIVAAANYSYDRVKPHRRVISIMVVHLLVEIYGIHLKLGNDSSNFFHECCHIAVWVLPAHLYKSINVDINR